MTLESDYATTLPSQLDETGYRVNNDSLFIKSSVTEKYPPNYSCCPALAFIPLTMYMYRLSTDVCRQLRLDLCLTDQFSS